jgi:hypothetical protein
LRSAITLGAVQTSARTAAIALVGTTFCLVDADFAPVEVGDLVTSSETLGHAMKATEPMKVLLRHHRKGAGSPARRTLRSSDSDRAAIGYTTDALLRAGRLLDASSLDAMATVEGLSRPILARQVIARASFRLLPGWELVTNLSQRASRTRSGTRANARSRNGSLPASPGTGAGWQAPIISIHVWLVCLANSAQLKPCGQQTVMEF